MLNRICFKPFQKKYSKFCLQNIRRSSSIVNLTKNGLEFNNKYFVSHQETRLNCRCLQCWYIFNQTKNLNLAENIVIDNIISVDDKYIHLKWDDGHIGKFPTNSSSAFPNVKINTSEELDFCMRKNSKLHIWSEPVQDMYKEFKFDEIKNDPEILKNCLIHLTKYGVVRIKESPQQPNIVTKIPDLLGLGPVWETVFGSPFVVKNRKDDSINHAYTENALPLHTDVPYYTQPPGVFLFHCILNECEGGESFYVDSFACVNEFKKQYPNEFKILCNTEVTFRDLQQDWHLIATHPIIQLTANGEDILAVYDNHAARDGFNWLSDNFKLRSQWYKAYSLYRSFVENPSKRFIFKMNPGDLTIFDNWRVYHARNSFKGDNRHMEGCYVEWSHVRSKILSK